MKRNSGQLLKPEADSDVQPVGSGANSAERAARTGTVMNAGDKVPLWNSRKRKSELEGERP
jgi:hypothetical protein